MRTMTEAEAHRDLTAWNDKGCVGCIYTAKSSGAMFSVRGARAEIRGSDIFIESTSDGSGLMHLKDCTFSQTEPHELPFQLKQGFPPLAVAVIKAEFKNNDVCFFFLDGPDSFVKRP